MRLVWLVNQASAPFSLTPCGAVTMSQEGWLDSVCPGLPRVFVTMLGPLWKVQGLSLL